MVVQQINSSNDVYHKQIFNKYDLFVITEYTPFCNTLFNNNFTEQKSYFHRFWPSLKFVHCVLKRSSSRWDKTNTLYFRSIY